MHDFVIVGGGTAGSVLTEQLSASGRHRVLLLEAGGEPRNPFIKIPAGFSQLFRSKVDWALESEPGSATRGRKVFIPRGKMLGVDQNKGLTWVGGSIGLWPADG